MLRGPVVPWARGQGCQGLPEAAGQSLAAGDCPSQPGQAQPWASGTILGMGTGWRWDGPGQVETVSYGLTGAGTDGPGGWNGVLGCG